jgi:prepilin-type N-terminal cleavage/methylation domain-containing protein
MMSGRNKPHFTAFAGPAAGFLSRKRLLRQKSGFTLLELCIVILIIVVMVGATAPVISGFSTEQQLRDPIRQLQLYSKTARRLAVHEGRDYEIQFNQKDFSIIASLPPKEDGTKRKSFSKTYQIKRGNEFFIQRWMSPKWRKPEKDRWVFVPSGLCEPLKVRVTRGKAWLECSFHPLTGAIQDESYYIP